MVAFDILLSRNIAGILGCFPCTKACASDIGAVNFACFVFRGKFLNEDFACPANETVLLIRPVGWLTDVAYEIACTNVTTAQVLNQSDPRI